jgi:ketosteroid isomerase-like protein
MTDRHPVVDRLAAAMTAHDLDALEACMHRSYRSEQPVHPARAFSGRAQVRENYALLFAEVPDLAVEVLRSATAGDEAWSEWRMHGTTTAGQPFDYRGMVVFGVRDDRIAWGRLYFEPVETGGEEIGAAMRRLVDER